jgi:hypothetical protein
MARNRLVVTPDVSMQDRRPLLCAQEGSRPRPRDDDQDMEKQVRS